MYLIITEKLTFIVIICTFFFTVYTISESGQDLFSMQIITVKNFLLENIDITLNNPNKYITNIIVSSPAPDE